MKGIYKCIKKTNDFIGELSRQFLRMRFGEQNIFLGNALAYHTAMNGHLICLLNRGSGLESLQGVRFFWGNVAMLLSVLTQFALKNNLRSCLYFSNKHTDDAY
jgi:hypothetical protein